MIRGLSIVLLLLVPACGFAASLPAPPNGYIWVELPGLKSAFLKPTGWFDTSHEFEPGTFGLFITQEDLLKNGYSCTGLTVFIVRHAAEKAKMLPSRKAKRTVQAKAAEGVVLRGPWEKPMDVFKSYGVVVRNEDKYCGTMTEHFLGIGNDSTGTYYALSFKAPSADWESAWKIGEPMLKKFLIDTDT